MKDIIGHRGAAGLALENTMAAFRKAAEVGVKTVEFDVRVTKDQQFVVCHDDTLNRVSGFHVRIADTPLAALQQISLHNGERIPLLAEVLEFARAQDMAVIVEIKSREHIDIFCAVLDEYRDVTITVASFHHDVIATIRTLRPHIATYLAESRRPLHAIHTARTIGAQGIDLYFLHINPLTYWLIKRAQLQVMLFSPDSPIIVRLLQFLYPEAAICTNHPERFVTPRNT